MASLQSLDPETYFAFLRAWGALGIASALVLALTRKLPVSSRRDPGWFSALGSIDKRLGWIVMELPILFSVSWFYWTGSQPLGASIVMVGAFLLHYVNRALVFPFRIKVRGKRMPVLTVLSVITFCTINGCLIGHYFGSLRAYPAAWLLDPRFLLGAILFVSGFVINLRADNALIGLRGPGESGYKIPRGGLFEYVSCPNFFGEIVEWIGFAIMSWSLPGLLYASWVSLTLFSTALETHRWYLDHFGEAYPRERRAVVPLLI